MYFSYNFIATDSNKFLLWITDYHINKLIGELSLANQAVKTNFQKEKSLPSFYVCIKKKSHFWILSQSCAMNLLLKWNKILPISIFLPNAIFAFTFKGFSVRIDVFTVLRWKRWGLHEQKLFRIVPSLGNSRSFYTQGDCIKMCKKYVFCKVREWWLWRRWWKGLPGEWGWQKTYWSWLS